MLIYYEANSKIIILPKTALLSYMYVFNLDLNMFSNIVIFRHISFFIHSYKKCALLSFF